MAVQVFIVTVAHSKNCNLRKCANSQHPAHILILLSIDSRADFVGIANSRIQFQPYKRRSCVRVLIQDDNVLELSETFDLHLETTHLHSMVEVADEPSVVNIIDDDGELKL